MRLPPASQRSRIRRSLRSTVDTTTPSRAAISALVSPSIFQTATARKLVPEAVEQAPALVGHQGGELGGGLLAEQQLDVPLGLLPERRPQGGAAGLAGLAAGQVDGLAHGQDEQRAARGRRGPRAWGTGPCSARR